MYGTSVCWSCQWNVVVNRMISGSTRFSEDSYNSGSHNLGVKYCLSIRSPNIKLLGPVETNKHMPKEYGSKTPQTTGIEGCIALKLFSLVLPCDDLLNVILVGCIKWSGHQAAFSTFAMANRIYLPLLASLLIICFSAFTTILSVIAHNSSTRNILPLLLWYKHYSSFSPEKRSTILDKQGEFAHLATLPVFKCLANCHQLWSATYLAQKPSKHKVL